MELPDELITALDIGTRSVTGIVGSMEAGCFRLKACHSIEHSTRAMHDGQIQDVEKVANVIREVKQKLESLLNSKITSATVAAAGRSLITHAGKSIRQFGFSSEISHEETTSAEIEATQIASESLALKKDIRNYYCIDYNVISYLIDGERILNPVGQRAEKLEVEVVATFLPRIVVDSLEKALEMAELKLAGLTLEPIAASNVVIPQDMRKLNIVLVDVGAGTSDIAISRDGSIFSYGMVPFAGDEVTETICKKYLVEFNVAEKIKRAIMKSKKIKYKNILGFSSEVLAKDAYTDICLVVDELASRISEQIIILNGGAPDAVLCVGGGSLTPGLQQQLAEKLGIESVRVAVRGTDAVRDIVGDIKLNGPEFVTPLGIALSHARRSDLLHCSVTVNDKSVRIIHLGKISAKDAILAAGIPLKSVKGSIGKAMSFELDDQIILVKGYPGVAAKIICNGDEISLETEIKNMDVLNIMPGSEGRTGSAMITEYVSFFSSQNIFINGTKYQLPNIITRNGVIVDEDFAISDQDKIRVIVPVTIEDALRTLKLFPDDYYNEEMHYWINGIEYQHLETNYIVKINGAESNINDTISDDCSIQLEQAIISTKTIDDYVVSCGLNVIKVSFNSALLYVENGDTVCKVNGRKVKKSYIIKNGDSIQVIASGAIFSDVFRYADIDVKKLGSSFTILLNNQKAQFTDSINDGDKLELINATDKEEVGDYV